jgi:DNA polymerase-3 subunit alpha
MSSVRDKTDKLVEYIEEAKKMGIAVLPPDVNESLVDFAVVGRADSLRPRRDQGRRRGRGRGDPRARERDGKFADLFDFTKRVDPRRRIARSTKR